MKFTVHLSIGLCGCERDDELEIDDEDLEGLTEKGIEEVMYEEAKEWAWNYIEISAKRIDG